jgi:Zn-dependent protease
MHEYAHAYVSYKLGDDTAKNMGRLSINPFVHLDLFGTIFLVLFGFGWAKPVGINPNKFKNRKMGMLLSAIAGPVMNILVALVAAFIYYLLIKMFYSTAASDTFIILLTIIQYIFMYNVFLCVFNLIPLPPLDGSKVLAAFLPEKIETKFYQYERQMYFILLILIVTQVIGKIMTVVGGGLINVISNFVYKVLGL